MIKHLITLLLISFCYLFPQDIDSLRAINDSTSNKIKTDSTILVNDASLVNQDDSLIVKEVIIPIQTQPLTETSFIISREDFLFNDYRYTGDFLKQFPLTFTQDLGFIGYPNQSFIYGIGDGGVSYMINGVLWNDRYFNSLDLNLIQSEDIDSIEIVPLPRGFLYGPFNNAVTVNFITRDFVSQAPYSRIKYYEGPDGEAMIDGKFNAQVMKRLNFSFEITNRGKDSVYTNTAFSLWQANAKLKYFLSNDFNLAVDYRFNHLKRGLNDGVDVDSIRQISSDVNSILYDPLQAPVNSPFKKQEITQNYIVLKTLLNTFEGSRLNLQFYYKHDLDELDNSNRLIPYNEIKNHIYGVDFNYLQRFGIFSGQVISDFDKSNSFISYDSNPIYSDEIDFNYLSVAGIVSVHLLQENQKLDASAFVKHFTQNYNIKTGEFVDHMSGYGFDMNYRPSDSYSFYFGYSIYGQFDSDSCKSIECGAKYTNRDLEADIRFFRRSNSVYYSIRLPVWTGIEIGIPNTSFDGIAAKLNFRFWKLLLETTASHYFEKDEFSHLPDFQFTGGIYLNDFFFNNNLNLKTGFKLNYTDRIGTYNNIVDPSNKLDFNLIGEIKERVIVYFTWENLFNNQYYITPYFPMPERNIRFGIAWELFN